MYQKTVFLAVFRSSLSNIYSVDDFVADKAIDLKREKKVKLADAIIASTGILNNFTLATINVDDFKIVGLLKVINPLRFLMILNVFLKKIQKKQWSI